VSGFVRLNEQSVNLQLI